MGKMYSRKVDRNGKKYEFRIEQYGGTSELQYDLETRQRNGGGFHDPDFGSWAGIKDEQELKSLMLNGYQPTVDALKEKVKVNVHGISKRIQFQNNVQGFAPVVPLALMNVPNNMIDMRVKPIKTKVIDVYYDITCPCSIDSNKIIEAGEKVLGAIIELERQGYKFNLYAVQSYCDERDCDMLIVKIKSSDKPFDLKRMSFALTHTGFFRIVGFDWYGKCPKARYRIGYGHHLGREFDEDDLKKAFDEMFGKQAMFFRAERIINGNKSQEYLKEVLENVGKGKS